MTKNELKKKIKALGKIDEETKKSIICNLIGHSIISTTFWGYRYCGRCGDQLGDGLGGIDLGIKEAVIAEHKCKECKTNFKKATWEDKLYCRNPFVKDYDKSKYLETL